MATAVMVNAEAVTRTSSVDVPAWDRVRDRRMVVVLLLAVWIVYLATATYGAGQVNDTLSNGQAAWSLGTRGTLDLPEPWRGTVDWEREGPDGQIYSNRNIGPILWTAPFYAIAEVFSPTEVPEHPRDISYAPAAVAAATVTALAIAASFVLFRRLASRRVALGATLALAFGSSVWSVSADAMWNHGLTHLLLVLGVLAASEDRHARSGLLYTAAILARPQVAVVAAVMGIWRAVATRSWRPMLVVGATSALGAIVVTVIGGLMFGNWLPVGGHSPDRLTSVATTSSSGFVINMANGLFHIDRGLFVFAPVLLVLAPFVVRGWRHAPWWVRSSAIAGVVYFVVQMRANGYDGGGGFFGSRLSIETLVLLTPLALRTWQTAGRRVRLIALVVQGVMVLVFAANELTLL